MQNALKNLDWTEIVNRLAQNATSEIARSELKNTAPLTDTPAAKSSFLEITEVAAIIRSGLRPQMESLDLYSSWYQRLIRNAVLKQLEIKDVRHFCIETLALYETLKDFSGPYIRRLRADFMNADEPLSAIDQIVTANGDIRSDASEKLHQLNVEKTNLGRQINNSLDRLVKDFQIEHLLQDRFVTTREGRWVLPIKSGMQHGFQGIIHDSSQSKQTVFMEPQEIVPLNNRLREIEIEIEQEIERLLIELSHYLSSLRFQFETTKKILIEMDQRLAQAQLMVLLDAHSCEFSSEKINLKGIRHPLLALKKQAIVTNNIEMEHVDRILLLSGPNAGGKTVLLKSIGLAAQMARCGLPICAEAGSQLPFFENIVVSLGDAQSVDANLSTFAAHLKSLDEASLCKGDKTLLLIDEICGSTDPEEGSALARGFIETYIENNVYAIITSHLSALKSGWPANSGVVNGSLEFNAQSGPTYRFIKGVAGQSLAIQTAERVGVSPKIILAAKKHLSPELRKYQESLSEIDKMKSEVLHIQNLLSQDLKTAKKEKEKYEKLIDDFNAERENLLNKEVRNAKQKIESLLSEEKVKDVFKRHEKLQKIKFELPEIIKTSQTSSAISPSGQLGEPITSAEDFARVFPPGSNVYIESLDRDGIVQGKPNAKGEVTVLSSSMRLTLPWQNLKASAQNPNPTQKLMRKSGRFAFTQVDSVRAVDVRGLSSEDAIAQLEIQLDAASLSGEDRIKVIHGHGTDTLKRAIRSHLSRSVYVKKWQAGTADSGGDGITWIEIK